VTWDEKLPEVPLAKIGLTVKEKRLASERDELKKELVVMREKKTH